AAGDAGGALGVALFTWYQLLENLRDCGMRNAECGFPKTAGAASCNLELAIPNPQSTIRNPQSGDFQKGSFLGPAFSDDEVVECLDQVGAVYTSYPDAAQMCDEVARLIADEKVIGWFQGRMEFGPRALGARSILGDARSASMQSIMNLKIKFRESFRPFAPI